MVKRFTWFSLMALLGVLPASFVAARPQVAPACLHGPSEAPANKTRREQALALAEQINRAEDPGPAVSPPPGRTYRPLEQLRVPTTPVGFKLQFYTDGSTYAFSLLDTRDPCHYAIFSSQNRLIYEATPKAAWSVHVLPTEIP
jgi:hypothetical protein